MKKNLPPKSNRYCVCCGDMTTFKYDKFIGHSRCIECGWHYIPTLDINGIYEKEIEVFELTKKDKVPTEKEIARNKQIQKLKELKKIKYQG